MNEVKELNKWRDILGSRIGRCNVKMPVLPNLIYRFNAITLKSQKVMLYLSVNWFWSLYGEAKDPEKPIQY